MIISSWNRLNAWLSRRNDEEIVFTLGGIEEILRRSLPASATRHRGVYWSNGGHAHANSWKAAGYRTSLAGVPHDRIRFVREGSAPSPSGARRSEPGPVQSRWMTGPVKISRKEPPAEAAPKPRPALKSNEVPEETTVVLIGCVKGKRDRPLPAGQLFDSPLFSRRRSYAEARRRPWWILSAQHCLLHPDTVISPYDVYLGDESRSYRQAWSRMVAEQLKRAWVT